MNENSVFTIMTCSKLEIGSYGWPDFGYTRTVGYYHELKNAIDAVKKNMCDIWETVYNYVIIEEVSPGLYPHNMKRWFFKYDIDKDNYVEIEEPEFMKNVYNITIG